MREIVLIDGYNLIYALEMEKVTVDLSHARDYLIGLLEEYAVLAGKKIIVVFDAYRVKGGKESRQNRRGVTVIFTREKETADTVIERLAGKMAGDFLVTVVTGDFLEQRLVAGVGALRITPKEFQKQLQQVLSLEQGEGEDFWVRLDSRLPEALRRRLREWKHKEN
ncbi:NYN domain-containing protein [Desulfothermobacter acidiphilus]|uniref:NYN domain-containing protein n=1 Tax=Desulfothermobacter acidiphilus TaxID=1938353 RepID=UPI003F8964D4